LALVLIVGVAGALLAGASSEGSQTRTYKLMFDNAFGLVEGGDFRIGGVKAGQTTGFEVREQGGRPLAEVEVEISQPGFGEFRSDARCDIRPQSLIGEYFVDCQPGSAGEELPDGGTVPVEQNTSTIPQDLVNNIMRQPTRERLRLIVSSLGAGLAGRPEDLGEVLRRAHPGLRETNRVLRILGDQNRVIERFIVDSDRVVEELEANKRDVVRWVRETGETAEISATRREDITRGFERLPEFLGELRPTMAALGGLADTQRPLLADLQRAAPDLEEFFTRLGPFSEASRPAIRSLGDSSLVATRAFEEGEEEVDELRALAQRSEPTARPLRQFLQTLDDRRRGIENDRRAKVSAPPAPDKTAIAEAGGFTGMEAFWNYWFWQALSINGFDNVGHILRISLLDRAEEGCGEFVNTAEGHEETLRECNQWLGPYQPGLTAPDFTEPSGGSSPEAVRARAERPATRFGERRGAGEPDAGPVPGQPDVSRPQIVVPPGVQELLDRLPRPGLEPPRTDTPLPRAGGDRLLDYLLAP